MSVTGRTIEVVDDTVTSTVRRDYHWKESGEFSHSMEVLRDEYGLTDDEIADAVAYEEDVAVALAA